MPPATETFRAFGQDFTLNRYPKTRDPSLRAWDTADEYLLNTLETKGIDLSQVCILHDNFGALSLPLAPYNPKIYTDSWLARKAILDNLALNEPLNPDIPVYTLLEELTTASTAPNYLIGRIPKSKQQLIYLLQTLNKWADPSTLLLLAGMDKHLSRGQFELLNQYFGPARFYPGVKKARIWEATLDKSLRFSPITNGTIHVKAFDLNLQSGPNVFSQDKLDIGARFFLENLNRLPEKAHVADLACGNGVLGLAYLKLHPKSTLHFVDESFQAVQSCRENIALNNPNAITSVEAGDGLKAQASDQFDLILCNPPFHLQHTISTEIAESLFKDAWRCLKSNGELWVVANRHLNYHHTLSKTFTKPLVEAANAKFVIFRCMKE